MGTLKKITSLINTSGETPPHITNTALGESDQTLEFPV